MRQSTEEKEEEEEEEFFLIGRALVLLIVKQLPSFKELNGSLTAPSRLSAIAAIVVIDVNPNIPPQTE